MVRRIIFAALALLALGGTTLFLWPVPMRAAGNPATLEGDTARGAYVARLGGCFACHTDTEGGGAIFAGGPPLRTPFGVFYAPNITMHETDGIGGWTIEDFDRAMRSGLSPKGTHYFPAFPYGYYTKMTDQDIADLWSAFQTVPPVANSAPEHKLSFPFDQRILLRPWKTLFLDPSELASDPERSALWNRGRYLTEGPGHCGACHTPRNLLGGERGGAALAGAIDADDEKIPAITPSDLGKAGYAVSDIAIVLKTGVTPEGDVLGGSMAEVVSNATRFWTEDDLTAIANYLLDEDLIGLSRIAD